MKLVKRVSAMILCAALIFSTGISVAVSSEAKLNPVSSASEESELSAAVLKSNKSNASDAETVVKEKKPGTLTECGGVCDYSPTIVIHGIGQSKTYLYDGDEIAVDEDGKQITGWPIYVNTKYIVKKLLWPLVKMLVTQRDDGFTDVFRETVEGALYVNSFDSNGKNVYDVRTKTYPYSVAKCTDEEKDEIYGNVPIDGFSEVAGEDHLYYYAYNSFGNNHDITDELYSFIQQVKRETGHDKVNIVAISLGGTIANSLFDRYPQLYASLDRVVYIVPALNGSNIVGDVYLGKLSTSDEMLYKNLLPSLMSGYEGYLLNLVIRIMPKQVLIDTLNAAVEGLTDAILRNCTTMWSLVPDNYYDEAVERILPGNENAVMRAQVAEYHEAQIDRFKNIEAMRAAGVEVFDIVDYDYQLYSLVESYDTCNADGIIQADSTSMGAKFANIGETLGDDYVQQGTHCDNPNHNHLSPDGVVDASAGLLPDHTFYFKGQDHEKTGSNDVIMKLATDLLLDPEFTDVYSKPDKFPQFNNGRVTKYLRKTLIPQAEEIDRSTLSAEDAAELDAALEECYAMLEDTVVDTEKTDHATERLENILIKIGVREAPDENEEKLSKIGEALCKLLSDAMYEYLGPRGYSDVAREWIDKIEQIVTEQIVK